MDRIPLPRKRASCQMLLRDPQVIYHGHLRRKKTIDLIKDKLPILNWSNCYVVIHEGNIYMFDNELSTSPDEASSLFGFTKCHPCPKEAPPKILWPFKLINALQKKHQTYFFSAPSESGLNKWVDIIRGELSRVNTLIAINADGSSGGSRSSLSSVMDIRALDFEDDVCYHGTGSQINKPDQTWMDFFWTGSTIEADDVMRRLNETGAFMVRRSKMDSDSMTLLVRAPGSVFKFKLNFKNNHVNLNDEEAKFDSINELINYYTCNNLSSCEIYLDKPYTQLLRTS